MSNTFLVLATSAIALSALALRGTRQDPEQLFETPIRIEADGERIDTGRDAGYAGPLVHDYDGDGLQDLLVSAFRGNIRFFKNVGTRAEPRFEEGEPLQAEGGPLEIRNW